MNFLLPDMDRLIVTCLAAIGLIAMYVDISPESSVLLNTIVGGLLAALVASRKPPTGKPPTGALPKDN